MCQFLAHQRSRGAARTAIWLRGARDPAGSLSAVTEQAPAVESNSNERPYPDVDPKPDFAAIERDILATWEAEDTFRASIEQRPADDEYVFYDGPPFANGLPHYGNLLTGYVKDVIPRYQTMRGHRV